MERRRLFFEIAALMKVRANKIQLSYSYSSQSILIPRKMSHATSAMKKRRGPIVDSDDDDDVAVAAAVDETTTEQRLTQQRKVISFE